MTSYRLYLKVVIVMIYYDKFCQKLICSYLAIWGKITQSPAKYSPGCRDRAEKYAFSSSFYSIAFILKAIFASIHPIDDLP